MMHKESIHGYLNPSLLVMVTVSKKFAGRSTLLIEARRELSVLVVVSSFLVLGGPQQ